MKLRALAFALLFLASSLALTLAVPPAQAGNGDTLTVGTSAIVPGNPCNAVGHAGGVSVDPVAKKLYYNVRSSRTIHVASTLSPYGPCASIPVPSLSNWGWDNMAFDLYHATVRLWVTDNATLYGLTLTGTVQRTFTLPGLVDAMTVDTANHRLLVSLVGQTSLFAYDTNGATPTLAAQIPLGYALRGLASWEGGILASDVGNLVRLHTPTGASTGYQVSPGDRAQDEFYQPYRYTYGFLAMALDAGSYAPKNALWILGESASSVCVSDCPNPVYECVLWENGVCLRQQCVSGCGGGVYATTFFPSIRAIQIDRLCPSSPVYGPCGQEPDCSRVPVPAPGFARPTSLAYHRNVPAGPASLPTAIQGLLTVRVTDASGVAGKILTVSGAGPTRVAAGADVVFDLDTATLPRGPLTLVATSADTLGCRIRSTNLTIWIENPTAWTKAQNVRVSGNIPLHLVAGTIALEPVDDLVGRETYDLANRQLLPPTLHADALHAEASHSAQGANVVARAQTSALNLDGSLDITALCLTLTNGAPECATLPPTQLDLAARDLASQAFVSMQLGPSSWKGASANLDGTLGKMRATAGSTDANADEATRWMEGDERAGFAFFNPNLPHLQPIDVSLGHQDPPQTIAAGPFTATLREARASCTALACEAYAALLTVRVSEGPYRGELVLGEAYSGISLAGRGLLTGPPAFVTEQDDYGLGGDATFDQSTAPILAPGLYGGVFESDDRADAFRVNAAPGQKLKVVLQQAHRATALANPIPTSPTVESAPRLMRLRLYDPLNNLQRDDSFLVADAHPAEVELNVDQTGAWRVRIDRTDARQEPAPYTLAVHVQQLRFVPGDTPNLVDAPDSCPGMALPPGGVTNGMLWQTEAADTWRVTLPQPGNLTAMLTLPDPEGAAFGLQLLDGACAGVAAASVAPGVVKGTPRVLAATNLPAGTYHVQVQRWNGIGNYALAVETA